MTHCIENIVNITCWEILPYCPTQSASGYQIEVKHVNLIFSRVRCCAWNLWGSWICSSRQQVQHSSVRHILPDFSDISEMQIIFGITMKCSGAHIRYIFTKMKKKKKIPKHEINQTKPFQDAQVQCWRILLPGRLVPPCYWQVSFLQKTCYWQVIFFWKKNLLHIDR